MLEFSPLFEFTALVDRPQVTPDGPYGTRRFIPIKGGSFQGERLSGKLLDGGADCQLIRPDGVAELEVRLTFETHDGVIFLMKGLGLRHGPPEVMQKLNEGGEVDPSDYYFRETMIFEAPKGRYDWLNKIIAVATGERKAKEVLIKAYQLL